MPKMRNISQRQFVIAGKTLKQGETGEFSQSVIDRHVASYAGELEAVAGEIAVDIKVDAKDVIEKVETLKNDPELTEEKAQEFVDSIKVESVESDNKYEVAVKVTADAPTPKRRGRKPKAKE